MRDERGRFRDGSLHHTDLFLRYTGRVIVETGDGIVFSRSDITWSVTVPVLDSSTGAYTFTLTLDGTSFDCLAWNSSGFRLFLPDGGFLDFLPVA